MEKMKVFSNDNFGKIRSIFNDKEILFVAKDVAKSLGYSNPHSAINRHIDEDDKGLASHDTLGGNQKITVINEAGLYSLILGSQLPKAKKFKKWVTSEVLPSIRKTGSYELDNKNILEATKNLLNITTDHDHKIKQLNSKIDNRITIDHGEQRKIQKAVNKKVVKRLGGKESKKYKNESIRSLYYSKIYSDIHDTFEVSSYRDIKKKDYKDCLKLIASWIEPANIKEKAS